MQYRTVVLDPCTFTASYIVAKMVQSVADYVYYYWDEEYTYRESAIECSGYSN